MRCGFARVRCDHCGHEYLLAFSCKRRHFCPSCHQKRVVEYGEWLLTEILKQVPHRRWVFSIPKRLRIYFMYDRRLQKIYEVDPLCCPNCNEQMRIISTLEADPIVKKILEHLDLRDVRNHDPPCEEDSYIPELVFDDSDSQIPQYDYPD